MEMDPPKILVVDDEEPILKLIIRVLSTAGYECDSAGDVEAAIDRFKDRNYDLLISDVKMPGNDNLKFVRKVRDIDHGLPVLLMTGYPELESAIQSIELGVVGYLIKPFDEDQLVDRVKQSLRNSHIYRAVASQRQQLQAWREELAALEESLGPPRVTVAALDVQAFLNLTFSNIVASLSSLREITEVVSNPKYGVQACELLNCPRLAEMRAALGDAVDVLGKTKTSFKSKELADLRKKLELLLNG